MLLRAKADLMNIKSSYKIYYLKLDVIIPTFINIFTTNEKMNEKLKSHLAQRNSSMRAYPVLHFAQKFPVYSLLQFLVILDNPLQFSLLPLIMIISKIIDEELQAGIFILTLKKVI